MKKEIIIWIVLGIITLVIMLHVSIFGYILPNIMLIIEIILMSISIISFVFYSKNLVDKT